MVELRRRLDRVLDISRASSYHNNGAAEDIISNHCQRSLFVLLYNDIHQALNPPLVQSISTLRELSLVAKKINLTLMRLGSCLNPKNHLVWSVKIK